MKNNKYWFFGAGIFGLILILFLLPKFKNNQLIKSNSVPCLVANVSLTQHIHPELKIKIDDKDVVIPANIGLKDCERALHTHDTSGTIHVEAQDAQSYTLGDFYSVWGEKIEKVGYNLEVTVNEKTKTIEELNSLVLKDKQQIILIYTKK